MDQSCQDIPMRLDIKHQPLNFDIYLEQVIDIPKTSINEPPYDFRLEVEALRRVDRIIERTLEGTKHAVINADQQDDLLTCPDQSPLLRFTTTTTSTTTPATVTQINEQCNSQSLPLEPSTNNSADTFHKVPAPQAAIAPPPSCPMEVPLTPIKCFMEPYTIPEGTLSRTTMVAPSATNKVTNCNSNQETSNSDRSTVNQINPQDFEEMHYNPFDHLELQTIDERKELDLVFQASYANRASKQ
jgi:hypothetical protein